MSIIKEEYILVAIEQLQTKGLTIELEEGLDYYIKKMTCYEVTATGKVWLYADEDDEPEILPDQVDWDDWEPTCVDIQHNNVQYYDFDDNQRTLDELKAIKMQEMLSVRKAIELGLPPWILKDEYQKSLKEFV